MRANAAVAARRFVAAPIERRQWQLPAARLLLLAETPARQTGAWPRRQAPSDRGPASLFHHRRRTGLHKGLAPSLPLPRSGRPCLVPVRTSRCRRWLSQVCGAWAPTRRCSRCRPEDFAIGSRRGGTCATTRACSYAYANPKVGRNRRSVPKLGFCPCGYSLAMRWRHGLAADRPLRWLADLDPARSVLPATRRHLKGLWQQPQMTPEAPRPVPAFATIARAEKRRWPRAARGCRPLARRAWTWPSARSGGLRRVSRWRRRMGRPRLARVHCQPTGKDLGRTGFAACAPRLTSERSIWRTRSGPSRSGRREAVRQTKCGNRWESAPGAPAASSGRPCRQRAIELSAQPSKKGRGDWQRKVRNLTLARVQSATGHAKADTTFCLAPLRPRSWLASPARPPCVFSQTQDQGATVGTGATKPLWPPAAQAEARCCWCDKARCQRSPGTAPQAQSGWPGCLGNPRVGGIGADAISRLGGRSTAKPPWRTVLCPSVVSFEPRC